MRIIEERLKRRLSGRWQYKVAYFAITEKVSIRGILRYRGLNPLPICAISCQIRFKTFVTEQKQEIFAYV